jgi:hypothetical protein
MSLYAVSLRIRFQDGMVVEWHEGGMGTAWYV